MYIYMCVVCVTLYCLGDSMYVVYMQVCTWDCTNLLYLHVYLYTHMRKGVYANVFGYGIGWLRLVGSLKWKVSFPEYRLFYGALLQKRPIILRSLLIVATPYWCVYMYTYRLHPQERFYVPTKLYVPTCICNIFITHIPLFVFIWWTCVSYSWVMWTYTCN